MDTTSQARVQVMFTIRENPNDPGYTDALYYTPDEYAAMNPKDLDAAQQARYAKYKEVLAAQPKMGPSEQAKALLEQKSDLEAKLAMITPEQVAAATAVVLADEAATAIVPGIPDVQPGIKPGP